MHEDDKILSYSTISEFFLHAYISQHTFDRMKNFNSYNDYDFYIFEKQIST